jgi:hypothetical protein
VGTASAGVVSLSMPSLPPEVPLQLVRDRSELAPKLREALAVELLAHSEVRIASAALSEIIGSPARPLDLLRVAFIPILRNTEVLRKVLDGEIALLMT